MIKKHWALGKEMEKNAFMADSDRGIPDRSYFSTKGRHPAHKAEWWQYDGQVDQGSAIERMRDESSLLQEERTFSRQSSEVLSQSRSRSSTLSNLPSRPTPPLQGGATSPQQGRPTTPNRTRHGRLTSIDERLNRTPELGGEEEDNSDQAAGSPTSPSFGRGPASPGALHGLRRSNRRGAGGGSRGGN
ncbi:hypothetical protein EJ02DRAFT_428799 [Clathrospora elynae]|uniref:Uncharacterized protein n=1 Tax=Clathrospora elynae TaxID=706981 RepID=A0A6A5SC77_9PLEO|nr:hypothetical protein EJ02DRAFT_428799 [Clathrospora elynae]